MKINKQVTTKMLIYIFVMIYSIVISSCNSDDGFNETERISVKFNNLIEGNIDGIQLWKTTVALNTNVIKDNTYEITAYSYGLDKTILFDKKTVLNGESTKLTIPQGFGNRILLIYSNGVKRISSLVNLTGVPQQSIDISFSNISENSKTQIDTKAATSPSLYGDDIVSNVGYMDVNIEKVLSLLQNVQEGINAGNKDLLEINYVLISNGPFNVSFLYGYTGCYESRILGYYYHSPGTYSDMKFVDLTETLNYDYIRQKAKLQYQLDGDKDKWYDANFDYRDGFTPPYTKVKERLDDDAYNIDCVISKYGTRITAMRGLSYNIDVPKGYRIGFYLKRMGKINMSQRASIISKGISSDVLPRDFTETNFTANALNTDGKLRSFYYQNDGVTFMGFEDAGSDGDFDCNDIIIGVNAELDKELPIVAYPDVDAIVQSYEKMSWTIAYEDIGRNADFDFNDAVISFTPNYETQTADVYACAAGGEHPIYIHYDGPDGDIFLSEIHEALGGGAYINTTSSMAVVAPQYIGTVKWPNEYTVEKDALRFYCKVKRGNCEDCNDIISLNNNPGNMPQAILVAGNWKWPKEGFPITTVYSIFQDWGKDATKMAYWNWYSYPKSDTYVNQ